MKFCLPTLATASFDHWKKDLRLIFVGCVMYCFWNFRNENCFRGKVSVLDAFFHLNLMIDEFSEDHCAISDLTGNMVEKWKPPTIGWWKINCDAAFVCGKVVLAFVVRDELGLLIQAFSKLTLAPSAFAAEIFAIEWSMLEASRMKWQNLCFSSDAQKVIKVILSGKDP